MPLLAAQADVRGRRVPGEAYLTNATFEFVGRDESVLELLKLIEQREAMRATAATDRNSNPLFAVHGGVGSGKSRYGGSVVGVRVLTLVRAGSWTALSRLTSTDSLSGARRLRSTRRAPHSCALLSVSTLRTTEPKTRPATTRGRPWPCSRSEFFTRKWLPPLGGVCGWRTFRCRYFFGAQWSFEEFRRWAPSVLDMSALDLPLALQCIRLDCNAQHKNVFVGVDELLLLRHHTSEGHFRDVLQALTTCLDADGAFVCLVSALNPFPLHQAFTDSKRPVKYVKLPPLDAAACEALFQDVALTGDEGKVGATGEPGGGGAAKRMLPPKLRHLVADACGHPRLLEAVHRIWSNPEARRLPLEALYFNVMEAGWKWRDERPDEAVVRAVLLGLPVALQQRIGNQQFADLVQTGVLTNSFDDPRATTTAVPEMPLIRLWHAVVGYISEQQWCGSVPAWLLSAQELLRAHVSFADGRGFQRFHAHWEVLVRALQPGMVTSLAQHYRVPDARQVSGFKDVQFQLPRDVRLKSHEHRLSGDVRPDEVHELVHNKPGADVAYCVEPLDGGRRVLVGVQTRYSSPTSSTTTISADKDDYEMWQERLLPGS